jgi:hypothetical protein
VQSFLENTGADLFLAKNKNAQLGMDSSYAMHSSKRFQERTAPCFLESKQILHHKESKIGSLEENMSREDKGNNLLLKPNPLLVNEYQVGTESSSSCCRNILRDMLGTLNLVTWTCLVPDIVLAYREFSCSGQTQKSEAFSSLSATQSVRDAQSLSNTQNTDQNLSCRREINHME